MSWGVSIRNGLVNGFLHGFICRPQCAELYRTLCDAVEDCEFSVRHFAKDGIVLRYRMYAGSTSPYAYAGGLQAKFEVQPEANDSAKSGDGDAAEASSVSDANSC